MMDEFLERAEDYYTDELPYHNFSHVKETLEAAEELIDRCREYNVDIDQEVVQAALAFHDASHQKNPERFGYEAKEDVSKEVARVELRKAGYEEEFVSNVEDCIEATKPGVKPEDEAVEEIVVRASDLRSMIGPYDEFQQNSEALRKEHEILHGSEPEYTQWVEGVLNTLHHYASQDLELTPEHETDEGLSEFHSQLGKNIGQFMHDYVEKDMNIEVEII